MMADSSNYTAGVKLFPQAPREYPGINGIINTNEDLAISVLLECQRQEIAIPAKMAIVAFRSHDFAWVVHPCLASVLIPHEEIGRLSANCPLACLQGEPRSDAQINVGFTLLAGESI